MHASGCNNFPTCVHVHDFGENFFSGSTNLSQANVILTLIQESAPGSPLPGGGTSSIRTISGEQGSYITFRKKTPAYGLTVGRLIVDRQFREDTLIANDQQILQENFFNSDFNQWPSSGQELKEAIEKVGLGDIQVPSPVLNQLLGTLILEKEEIITLLLDGREEYIQTYESQLSVEEQDIIREATREQIDELRKLELERLFWHRPSVYVLFPRRESDEDDSGYRGAPVSWLEAVSIFFNYDKASFGHELVRALAYSHVIVVGSEDAANSISAKTFDFIERAGMPEEHLQGVRATVVHRIEGKNAEEIKEQAKIFYEEEFNKFLSVVSNE